MYILLQHFPFEKRAIIKSFEELIGIETYMESEIETSTGFYDYYAGSSVMHRVLTKKPNYDNVIGIILNGPNDSNGIIYQIEDIDECFMLVKFATDTITNCAPWITTYAKTYINETGTGYPDLDQTISTNLSKINPLNWNHIVVNYESVSSTVLRTTLWVNGTAIATNTFNWTLNPAGNNYSVLTDFGVYLTTGSYDVYTMIDEIAFYDHSLTNSTIIDHYYKVQGASPNVGHNASPATAEAILVMPTVIPQDNNTFQATPITANILIVEPTVTAQYFIGDGSLLTNLPSGTNYSNANVDAYLPTYTGNLVSLQGDVTTTANITGNYILCWL
mgnify:CR=1 FL=1